jgi:hypothetical protein
VEERLECGRAAVTGQREIKGERKRRRQGKRERERKRERGRERDFFKGMMGALAPFSYLVNIC